VLQFRLSRRAEVVGGRGFTLERRFGREGPPGPVRHPAKRDARIADGAAVKIERGRH